MEFLRSLIALAAVPLLLAQDNSARELINELNNPPGLVASGVFTCGSSGQESRRLDKIRKSLVSLGSAALPDIEAALNAQDHGGYAFHTLAYLYARLKGREAYPLLLTFMKNEQTASVGSAAALAIGATSFVSSNENSYMRGKHQCTVGNTTAVTMQKESCAEGSQEVPMGAPITCGSLTLPNQPQRALDQFILGWDWDDHYTFERYLGPHAKETFQSTKPASGGVDPLAATISRYNIVIGYKFLTPNPWSDSNEPDSSRTARRARSGNSILEYERRKLWITCRSSLCTRIRTRSAPCNHRHLGFGKTRDDNDARPGTRVDAGEGIFRR